MGRMVMRHGALASDRLRKRNAALLREVRQQLLRSGVAHPTAGDNQRSLGALQEAYGLGETGAVWPRPRHRVDRRLEKSLRIVPRQFLNVLGQADERRPAIG